MRFVAFDEVPANERGFSGPVSVYALIDPRDDTVRYVGVTRKRLEARLSEHLESPTNRRTRAWFAELASEGFVPDIERLQFVERNWELAEMEWIAWFRIRGDLLNVDDGGLLRDAGSGWDDVKAAKAQAIYDAALAHGLDDRPPPCAQEQRPVSELARERRRLSAAMKRGERKAAKRREKAQIAARAVAQEAARKAVSIEPTIRRKGAGKPGEDRGRFAHITPRDALGGAR